MFHRSTHAGRMSRWLGDADAEELSRRFKGWYGPPVPVFGVPGNVYVAGGASGGDFVGKIQGGYFANLADYATGRFKRIARNWSAQQFAAAGAGFTSLSDLISEATSGGKSQAIYFNKTGAAPNAVGQTTSTFWLGNVPAAAPNSAAAPGGTAYNVASAGAMPYANGAGGDTTHLTTITAAATGAVGTMLLYDHLFSVNMVFSAANTQVTGVPLRYDGSVANGSAVGNFITVFLSLATNATATNLSVGYQDEANNASQMVTQAERVSAALWTVPLATGTWFFPLAAGDTGANKITYVASSVGVTGVGQWTLGHVLAVLPMPVVNLGFVLDGINSAFNLVKIEPGACLAVMDWTKASTTACVFNGFLQLVSG